MTTHIPDQTGRTAIITGGSSGIGKATAMALAAKGARVILAVRDQNRGRAAAAEMGGLAESRPLDLGSLASVREFADTVDAPVDYLINNAGSMTSTLRHTADGFESQFGTNHLGHFALTNLLLGRVTRRVITVSSTNYRNAHIDFEDLQWQRRPYRPFGAYGQTKLANLLFTRELQRRLDEAGSPVLATAAHPGWAATGFTMTTGKRLLDRTLALATRLLAQTAEGGARPVLLATVGDVPGAGFCGPSRFGVRGPAALEELSGEALDDGIARELWEVSERLTRVEFPMPAA
ncbi:NAD(P)-dependent dehydrogenase (short-subunit alcohol dehydrogenase family) [Saccharothrix coeruleofusca]|uniref:oxidoreductase n=1 Tax=Saccharothrix coeruleofusca TaxID=33919 RepID=UPI001AE86D41|nr:oxidoreductase [Saccharothrix coeruleofusca]MBP2334923.1 NAD(P)-dependent dehydrogenase (short-subunit alcohol dehydrogenase family) [Saccharothrix coeruleofusca]